MFKILCEIGAEVKMLNRHTVRIDPRHVGIPIVPYEMARRMRASYYFMGALLGRFGRASVSMPGGCDFGVRPIDQHIKGFEALGATVSLADGGMVDLRAQEIVGTHIYFDTVTVGATINVILAAVKAKGITILENVAKEPHIVDLVNFLNSMGADIRGAGTDVIKVHGVEHLHGATYSIIPDQIEAGTFMVAAAATKGDVLIKNVIPKHLESITDKLTKAGVNVEEYDDSVRVWREGELVKESIKTMPHPGFPTDMQPQMTTLLAMARGTSIVTEGVYDNRFKYVDELRRMGANIGGRARGCCGRCQHPGGGAGEGDGPACAPMLIAAMAATGMTGSRISSILNAGMSTWWKSSDPWGLPSSVSMSRSRSWWERRCK
ncbi:MAG: UDP-N-acetylglucosamine 1-carboxyvinyltransferase [Oscillospiraceae bacterium]